MTEPYLSNNKKQMEIPTVSNPNDFKVVEFRNSNDFVFTPEMGAMYDGRPISGITGVVGINAGESITLPYHIAHRLAENLAKYVLVSGSSQNPPKDSEGNPIIASIWDSTKLEQVKNSYLTELYSEEKPVAQSETDRLMAKVEEYKQMVDKLIDAKGTPEDIKDLDIESSFDGYKDKAEVILALEKAGIPHDKRKGKAELEKLLVA